MAENKIYLESVSLPLKTAINFCVSFKAELIFYEIIQNEKCNLYFCSSGFIDNLCSSSPCKRSVSK